MNTILLKPVISEKSMQYAEKGKFTFLVAIEADKRAIKKEVEERFKVNVLSIGTMIVKGRTKRVGKRREEVMQTRYKKASVQLKTGQKIDIFEIGG